MSTRMLAAASLLWTIGAWLRFHDLQAMEFKADERTSLELAIQFIAAHPWSSPEPWPSHGMLSSNGVGNTPLFTWIVAPLWALTHHPVGVTALIAAINAVCLIPLWFWAQRRMDAPRALLTLAIASVSPFAVLFSRKIWPVDVLLPGLLALLWSIEWLRERRVWRALALAGFGVLLITHLHQSGLITAPLLLVALAVQWIVDARRGVAIRVPRPSLSEMVAIAIVIAANLFLWWTYLPYLVTVPVAVYQARPRATSFAPELLLNVLWEIVPREVSSPFFGERLIFRADPFRWTLYYGALALGTPLAAFGVWRWLRAPLTLPVVGMWWWLIIIAFAVLRIPSHPHYVLAVLPLPVILAAGAFDGALKPWWARALGVWRWTYVAVLLSLTIVTGAWLTARGGSAGDYGVAFEIQQAQAQALLDRLRSRPPVTRDRFGEMLDDSALDLRCLEPSAELVWIARWLDRGANADDLERFRVCAAWTAGAEASYRWSIRDASSIDALSK
ncbi:MAG: hypothetical protein ACRD2A_01795 [Vicinamibacterales bacterium]